MNRSIRFVSSSRTRLSLIGAVLIALATSVVAVAYFATSGTGTGIASTGTLTAPTVSATPSAGMVAFSWSTVTPPSGSDPVTYYVTRVGGSVGGNCPTSAAPTTVTGCADSGLVAGTYSYTVTAQWRSWTATSAVTPVTVTSGAATHFLLQAATTTPTAGQGDNLTITAEDAANITVTAYTGDRSLTFGGASTIGAFHPTVTDKSGAPTNFGTSETITFTNGVATVTPTTSKNGVMSLAKAELATITVTDGSISNTGLNVTVSAAAVSSTSVASGSGQSATILTAFTNPLVALVQDGFGNPVSGVAVTFTAPASSASGTFANTTITTSASTGIDGRATATTFTANGTAGGYSVGATTPGATTASFSLTNNKANQAITFTSSAPQTAKVGATYAATATGGGSTSPIVFSIDASTSAVCSIVGSTVTFKTLGTCTVDANRAGDANYNAAPQVQQSAVVTVKGDQAVSFTSTAPLTAKVGATYAVTATGGGSTSPVVLSIDATTSGVCSIVGSTVTFTTLGTCKIDANQAGDANYNAAAQVQQSAVVTVKGDQTISFTSAAPGSAKFGGATYTPAATATSGLTVAFTIDASASAICSISGGVVSFVGIGTCVIDANQAGNGNWNPAPQAQQSFAVAKGDQTITFGALASKTFDQGSVTVSATASSGLAVSYTSTTLSVCTVGASSGVVSFVAAGSCSITAGQGGNSNWNAATSVPQGFTIGKGNQTITFGALASKTFDQGSVTVSATASSGLAVSYTSTTLSVCTVGASSGVVSFVAAGSCSITADQGGNSNWNAAASISQGFTIGKGNQTITFSNPGAKTFDQGPLTVSPTASSGLSVALTSATVSVCTVSGSTITFVATGTCTINANQAGNANWLAATQVQQSFTISKGNQTITFTSTAPADAFVSGPTYTPTATASSGLTVTFTIDSSATSICSISGGVISFTAAGTCLVDANQAGSATWSSAPQAQQTVAVSSATTVSKSAAGTYTLTVPAHKTRVTFTMNGGGGGGGNAGAAGGAGGTASGTITIPDSSSATTFTVIVGGGGGAGGAAAGGSGGAAGTGCALGGVGGSGSNVGGGGGGGGATCIYLSGAPAGTVVTVGGGGGGGAAGTGTGGAGDGGPGSNPGTSTAATGATSGGSGGAGGKTVTSGTPQYTITNTAGAAGGGNATAGGTCAAGVCGAGGTGGNNGGNRVTGGGGGGGGMASGGGGINGGNGANNKGGGGGGGSAYTGGTASISVSVSSASNGGGGPGGGAGIGGTAGSVSFTGIGLTLT
jgi:hypothetical protein